MKSAISFVCLTLLIIGMPGTSSSELDDAQLRLLQQYELPLRWDNVDKSPLWVSGMAPSYSVKHRMSTITLKPGSCVNVMLPAYEILRIMNPDGALPPGSVEVSASQGTGLQAYLGLQATTDGRSLLLAPNGPDPLMCRVSLPMASICGLTVAIFVSRRDTLDEIAPYRRQLCLPGCPIKLKRSDKCGSEKFFRLTANCPVDVDVKGPCRLAVESRIVCPTEDTLLQNYRFQCRLDGVELSILDAETAPENTKTLYVKGCSQVLGRLRRGFVEIPCGSHRLTLTPTADVIARTLLQSNPDYLFPTLNQPKITAGEARGFINPVISKIPSWGLDDRDMEVIVATPQGAAPELEKVADRLRLDNSRREGALVGTSILESSGRQRPDAPEVRNKAQEFQGFNTGFRSLIPSNKISSDRQQFGWFVDRNLKRFDEPDLVVAARHMNSYLDRLASGFFVTLPVSNLTSPGEPVGSGRPGGPLHYWIPKRFAPTRLRVAVEKSHSVQNFVIKMVGGDTIAFALVPGSEAPISTYKISQGEAGLELLRINRPGQDATTLGGPFSLRHNPAPLKETATFELNLPPNVSEVFAWAYGPSACPIRLSLQYRESNPFRMSERDYIEAENLLGCDDACFREFVRALTSPTVSLSNQNELGHGFLNLFALAKKDLKSFWLPLVYLLKSNKTTFEGPVKESIKNLPGSGGRQDRLSATQLSDLTSKAQRAEKGGQWLISLEEWGEIYHRTTGSKKSEAALMMTKSLRNLGEMFLAEMFLRYLYVQPDGHKDAELSKAAFNQLLKMYKANFDQTDDPQNLLSLYATEVLMRPEPQTIRDLCSTLILAGHYEMALMAGMALPRPERPVRDLLRASRYVGWFHVYSDLIPQLGDQAERNYWSAFKSVEGGAYVATLKLLGNSGELGKRYADTIRSGLTIQDQLKSCSINDRVKAVTEWEIWQANHPGPHRWAEEPDAISDYSGGVTLYSIPRDLYFRGFKAGSSRPVRANIYGPVAVRITARPLHVKRSTQPLNGWVQIKTGDEKYIAPINNNTPSEGLTIVGDSRHQTGQLIQKILTLGPGPHDIEVHGGDIPIIVNLESQRPEMSLGLLPQLTPDTVDAALRGPVRPEPTGFTDRISCLGRTCLTILPFPNESRPIYICDKMVIRSTWRPRELPALDNSHWKLLAGMRSLVRGRIRDPNPGGRRRALDLGRGDILSALRQLDENDSKGVMDAMDLLVYWGETQPARLSEAEARAQRLCEGHPAVPEIRSLLPRLSDKTAWESLSLIQATAGLKFVRLTGWEPEGDSLRVRKALIEPVAPGERVVAGRDKTILVMENLKPSDLEIKLSLMDLRFLPPAAMKLTCQLDDEKPHEFTLSGQNPSSTLRLAVPTGRHRVSVWIRTKYANQFLKVNFCEKTSDGRCLDLVMTKPDERLYYVATHQRPVRAEIEGPSWVRIDELRDGDQVVSYRFFEHGWHELNLTPGKGEKEALFRIQRKIIAPAEQDLTIPRPIEFYFAAVPGPVFSVGSAAEPRLVVLDDEYRLGKQQDGTWSLSGTYRKPRDVDEPIQVSNSPQASPSSKPDEAKFVEVAATYRYFEQYLPGYCKGTFLSRVRETGGPTIGFLGDAVYYPTNFPWNVGLATSLYIQKPGAETFGFFGGGSAEYCGTLEGSVTQVCEITPKFFHLPSISVFGRVLSMETNTQFPSWWVDDDVFTKYKAEHKAGLKFGEYFEYKPWLDTIWFSRISAQTNQNLSPINYDNVKVDAGWKQLLGRFQMDVVYKYSFYFAGANRTKSSDRHILAVELACDRWMISQRRLQLLCKTDFDFDKMDVSGYISLSYFFGEGRGLRDFRPSEADFVDIRKRRVPQIRNNHISPGPESFFTPITLGHNGL